MAKAQLLEDFIENYLESLPNDVQQSLYFMTEKEKKMEDHLKLYLRKKRSYLKSLGFTPLVKSSPTKSTSTTSIDDESAVAATNSATVSTPTTTTATTNESKVTTSEIRKEYQAALSEIDEKITAATQLHDLLEKHVKKLVKDMEEIGIVQTPVTPFSTTSDIRGGALGSSSPAPTFAGMEGDEEKRAQKKRDYRFGFDNNGNHIDRRRKQYRNMNLTSAASSNLLESSSSFVETSSGSGGNEPLYCFCQQVSFGDMVACDNPQCEKEWFHYQCVGLITPPVGKWYCTDCLAIKLLPNHGSIHSPIKK